RLPTPLQPARRLLVRLLHLRVPYPAIIDRTLAGHLRAAAPSGGRPLDADGGGAVLAPDRKARIALEGAACEAHPTRSQPGPPSLAAGPPTRARSVEKASEF